MIDMQRIPNRDRLLRTARVLRPLLGELVFVGGQVAELLVTDPAAVRVRPTDDVAVVVPITTRTAYHCAANATDGTGLHAGPPRRRTGVSMRTTDDLILDVMPLDEAILGFSNRWYSYALASATARTLEPTLDVRIASAAAFLAMKWEAFGRRGAADPMSSHDLEDMIRVVAGRVEIIEEVRAAPDEVRQFINAQTNAFLATAAAADVLEGNLPDARRVPGSADAVLARFQQLATVD